TPHGRIASQVDFAGAELATLTDNLKLAELTADLTDATRWSELVPPLQAKLNSLTVSGALRARLRHTRQDGSPQLTATIDATRAGFTLPETQARKAPGVPAELSLQLTGHPSATQPSATEWTLREGSLRLA